MDVLKNVYGTITLITENSLQSSLLRDALEKALKVTINIVAINNLNDSVLTKSSQIGDLIIIDMSVCTKEAMESYLACYDQHFSGHGEVLINCDKSCCYSELTNWSNLVGVFYNIDGIDLLTQGISKILQGELWLSRKLAQEYILHFRKNKCVKTSTSFSHLTKREQQIIKLLGNGDSNVEIASKLFVSENTVKTHLHNIFKKINVKNRLQALIWVKENIGLEEFI